MSVLVLVVDDEADVEALFRQQFRRDLRTQRFVMDFANSAADALMRIAGTIEQTLVLILSDINMPGMTGLEMLPKVREMHPDVPIIMITAYGDPKIKRKAIEGGATVLARCSPRAFVSEHPFPVPWSPGRLRLPPIVSIMPHFDSQDATGWWEGPLGRRSGENACPTSR